MRHLNGVFTQRINKLYKKDGPLFRGRYKAILVQEDEYLTHIIRYIHLNPVQAYMAQTPNDYPWSSHKYYLRPNARADWLWTQLGLAFFNHRLKEAVRIYQQFLKSGIDRQTLSFYSQKKQQPIFGDPDFIEMIKQKYIPADQKLSTEIPEKRLFFGHKVADKITKETTKLFKTSLQSLGKSRRGETNYARLSALNLTREMSGLKLSEIADFFGMDSYKTVSTSCRDIVKSCGLSLWSEPLTSRILPVIS
jgi:hypothetical protein